MLEYSCYLCALDRGQAGDAGGERVSQHMHGMDLCLQFQ